MNTEENIKVYALAAFGLTIAVMIGLVVHFALVDYFEPKPMKVEFDNGVVNIASDLSGDFYDPNKGDTVAVQLTYIGEELIQIAVVGKWANNQTKEGEDTIARVHHKTLVNVIEKAVIKNNDPSTGRSKTGF